MAQTGYTPISLYYSSTASATPTAGNLVAGELAINTADGKLFYKDSSGVVQVIAGKGGAGVAGGSNTQVQYNSSGSLAGSANLTFNGTTLTTLNSAYTGTFTGGTGVVNLGSGQFYKDASGNVGIGTSNPSSYNAGLVVLNSNTFSTALVKGTSTSGASGLVVQNDTSTSDAFMYAFNSASGSLNTLIGTSKANNLGLLTNNATRLTIDSAGFVGIGITSPAGKLQVAVDGQTNNTNAGLFVSDATSSSRRLTLGYNSGSQYGFIQAVEAGVAYKNLVLQAEGANVGIGTSNPTQKLQVEDAGNVTIQLTKTSVASFTIANNGTSGTTLAVESVPMIFQTGGSERMRITSSGFVGVGTTAPPALLSTVNSATTGYQQKANGDITEASNFFQRQITPITNVTSYATINSIATSIGAGGYCRCYIKMSAMGHTSGVANGATIDAIWYVDFFNSSLAVAQVSAGTSTGGGAPAIRLNVSGTTIQLQVQSSNGTNRFDGMFTAEMYLSYGAGSHPTYTVS